MTIVWFFFPKGPVLPWAVNTQVLAKLRGCCSWLGSHHLLLGSAVPWDAVKLQQTAPVQYWDSACSRLENFYWHCKKSYLFFFSCWNNCCKNLPVMLQEDLYWKKRWCISVAVYELCGQRILYLRGGFVVTSFAEVNLINLVLLTKWEVEKVSGVIYWTLPRMQIHCTVPYLACLWPIFLLPRRKGRTMEGEAAEVCGECLLTRAVTPVLLKV